MPSDITAEEILAAKKAILNKWEVRFSTLHRGFLVLDKDRSGKITREEFKAIILTFNLDASITGKLFDALYAELDEDGSGSFSYNEMQAVFGPLSGFSGAAPSNPVPRNGGMMASPVRTADQKKKIRSDVSADDILAAKKAIMFKWEDKFSTIQRGFLLYDSDRSGKITREEFKSILLSFNLDTSITGNLFDALYEELDEDGSGYFTYEEMQAVFGEASSNYVPKIGAMMATPHVSTRSPVSTRSRTGDPESQKQWHGTYRDMVDNMYRTTYQDMIHGREVSVRNDFPAGYGGHVPSLRHDVLFRNTEFDRMHSLLRSDPGRDVFPSFVDQNQGLPTYTKFPKGVVQPPTAMTGADVLVKPPWALTLTLREPPTFRTNPAVTPRLSLSARGGQRPVTTPGGSRNRVNQAAVKAGQLAFNLERDDRIGSAASQDYPATFCRSANEKAAKITMPSEADVLSSAQR